MPLPMHPPWSMHPLQVCSPFMNSQVCRALIELGHSITVVTMAPAGFFIRELPSKRLAVRRAQLDFGAKQKDAFSVDMTGMCHFSCSPMLQKGGPLRPKTLRACAASLEGYRRIAGGEQRATLLETETAWLAATKPDLVASDVVPLACAAAAAASIPAVCISNFAWGASGPLGLLCHPDIPCLSASGLPYTLHSVPWEVHSILHANSSPRNALLHRV